MKFLWLVLAMVMPVGAAQFTLPTDRTNRLTLGYTIGPQVPPSLAGRNASNIVTHGADPLGLSDSSAAIGAVLYNSAISGAYAYAPNGVYRLNSPLIFNTNNVMLWGESTNAIFWRSNTTLAIQVGHDRVSDGGQAVHFNLNPDSLQKGSTNVHFMWNTNEFGDVITAGESFWIAGAPTSTNTFRIISTSGFSNRFLWHEPVVIHTITGTNATITAPLWRDHTNNPTARSTSFIQLPTSFQQKTGIVVGNITITGTNFGTGFATTSGNLMQMSMVRNSLVSNVCLYWAGNRALKIDDCNNNRFSWLILQHEYEITANHAGILLADSAGNYFEHCILANRLFPAIEYNEGTVGNYFFGLFTTNCGSGFAVDAHNSHPYANFWDHCIFDGIDYFKSDGYFGSVSDMTIFRSKFYLMDNKRWTTRMNVIGCQVGDTSINYTFEELMKTNGRPNLGNDGFFGTSPPMAWTYPGPTFTGPDGERTNGITTIALGATSDTFLGDFSYLVSFADFPGNYNSHPIVFQHQTDTNILVWPGTIPILALEADITHVKFNQTMTLTTGMRVFAGGTPAWQQKQIDQFFDTFIIYQTRVHTNSGGTVVDIPSGSGTLPDSLLHASEPEGWEGPWPGIGPDEVNNNPAKNRYYGIVESDGVVGTRGRNLKNVLRKR